jgi:MraZ protein
VLFGEHRHSLDGKNRLVIPKRIQEQLSRSEQGALLGYLSAGPDRCLYLFSAEGFERVQREFESRTFASPDQRAAQRLFYANTVQVELDASGRALLPEKLKKHAGIDKDVVLVGVKDRAEIWAKETWEAYEAANGELLQHLDEVLRGNAPELNRG